MSSSPLRSKRASTSPVRPRSNASGLIKIRVRELWATSAEGYRAKSGGRSGRGGRPRSVLARLLLGPSRARAGAPRGRLALLLGGGLARAGGRLAGGRGDLVGAVLLGRLAPSGLSRRALGAPAPLRRPLDLGDAARLLRASPRRTSRSALGWLAVGADRPSG